MHALAAALFLVPKIVELRPPSPRPGDLFGISITTGGGAIAVGAPGANEAHLFTVDGEHAAVLRGPEPGIKFGWTVAIVDEGGPPILAVTAHDAPQDGVQGVGAVYLYDQTTLLPVGVLHPPASAAVADLGFGNQLAPVGDKLLVGSHHPDRGGAWLFARDGTLVRSFEAPAGAGFFGRGVAGLRDGTCFIGAPGKVIGHGDPPGAVYVYQGRAGARASAPVRTLHSPSPAADDLFGVALSVSDDGKRLLVGESGDPVVDDELVALTGRGGAVYLIDARSGSLMSTFRGGPGADDLFGWSVRLLDARWAAVSAPYADASPKKKTCNGGAAYAVQLATGKMLRFPVRGLRCDDWLGGFRIDGGELPGGTFLLAGASRAFGSTRPGRAFLIGPLPR